jgi:hypothetical protein
VTSRRALQSRADGGDKLFADVGDTHIGLRQRIDACISAPEVELDSVRGRVCLGGHDRVRIAVEPDDWSKAQFRAAIASTPEPQPTSSKEVGSSSLRSSRQSRVVGCDPVPNARPGSIVIASSSCGACSQGGTIQMRPARTGR